MLLYFSRLGTALTILLNVILGGPSNQTFSARNWERKKQGKPNLVCVIDTLFFWDDHHCMMSWVYWSSLKYNHDQYIKDNDKCLNLKVLVSSMCQLESEEVP